MFVNLQIHFYIKLTSFTDINLILSKCIAFFTYYKHQIPINNKKSVFEYDTQRRFHIV